MLFIIFGGLAAILGLGVVVALMFRRVVSPNEVHIVQSSRDTKSYGKDTQNGNVYYEWPSSLPVLGVEKVILPVSVFELSITGYEAYDVGRVPFVVDITSFFRIKATNLAAQRVSSFQDLNKQLEAIVKGAARSILASSDIEEIMESRSTFGDKFTNEVAAQLKEWGVETVKNIELMDIRDSDGDIVIENIMKKKKSLIEKESRQQVAENLKEAQLKEIDAKREVEVENQKAQEAIGLRTVENKKKVSIAQQSAMQEVKDQERLTKEKEMAVKQVEDVRTADIAKEVQVVTANQEKETQVIRANASKETRIIAANAEYESAKLTAEAQLELKRKESEGIELEGTARATAKKQMELAPVSAQIELAREIGENDGYQNYLITVRQVEAQEAVGIQQAKALNAADVKIISNSDSPTSGLTNVMDIFSSKGGVQVGAMLEGFANSEKGQALLNQLNIAKGSGESPLNGSGKKH